MLRRDELGAEWERCSDMVVVDVIGQGLGYRGKNQLGGVEMLWCLLRSPLETRGRLEVI